MTEVNLNKGITQNEPGETEAPPITLTQYGERLFKQTWRDTMKPGWGFGGECFHITRRVLDGPTEPYLRIGFNPFVMVGRSHAVVLLLGVNNANVIPVDKAITEERHASDFNRFSTFPVWDFDPEKVDDPTYTEGYHKILPSRILVPPTREAAGKNGSWVIDEHVRERINQWFQADQADHRKVNKYMWLRGCAVGAGHPEEVTGINTYQDVVRDSQTVTQSVWEPREGKKVDKPRTPLFTPEDVEWLETYMSNKGLPLV